MTGPEVKQLIDRLVGTWPQTQFTPQMAAAWIDALREVPADDALAAYRVLLGAGSPFTPSLAQFTAGVAEVQQGPPPLPEQVDEVLRRNASRWPYRGHVSASEHTAGAVRQLMSVGAHEAVCRFVQQVGGREAAEMPDAAMGIVDQSASVRRHELLKTYREQVVSGWRADPRPGLALDRAVEQVGLRAGGDVRRVGEGMRRLGAGG